MIDNNEKSMVIAGDLFHNRTHIGVSTLITVYKLIKNAKNAGIEITIIGGNHDQYITENDKEIFSISIFNSIANVIEDVTDLSIDGVDYRIIPFMNNKEIIIDNINKSDKQILTHIGTQNAKTGSLFTGVIKSPILASMFNKPSFSGHYHLHQTVDNLTYIGSPMPFTFADGMTPHGFIKYNGDGNNFELINVIKELTIPDFITIPFDMLNDPDVNISNDDNVRIIIDESVTTKKKNSMKKILSDKGVNKVVFYDKLIKDKERKISNELFEEVRSTINLNDIFDNIIDSSDPKVDIIKTKEIHKDISDKA